MHGWLRRLARARHAREARTPGWGSTSRRLNFPGSDRLAWRNPGFDLAAGSPDGIIDPVNPTTKEVTVDPDCIISKGWGSAPEPDQAPEPTPSDMTLRDWFAAHALATLANARYSEDDVATVAYRIADAMMAERERRTK
jgi:hypothetical protein